MLNAGDFADGFCKIIRRFGLATAGEGTIQFSPVPSERRFRVLCRSLAVATVKEKNAYGLLQVDYPVQVQVYYVVA